MLFLNAITSNPATIFADVPDEGCTAILNFKDWVAPVTAMAILGAQPSFAGKRHTVAVVYCQWYLLYQYHSNHLDLLHRRQTVENTFRRYHEFVYFVL